VFVVGFVIDLLRFNRNKKIKEKLGEMELLFGQWFIYSIFTRRKTITFVIIVF
jgi:hypothetical protein